MRKYLLTLIVVALGGCANYGWYKEGVSQQDAKRDNYDCLREAQQRVSGAQVNPYGGPAVNTVVANPDLFDACAAARGYTWRCMSNCS
jgi:hypothetical protein